MEATTHPSITKNNKRFQLEEDLKEIELKLMMRAREEFLNLVPKKENSISDLQSRKKLKDLGLKINIYSDGTGDIFWKDIEIRFYDLKSMLASLLAVLNEFRK